MPRGRSHKFDARKRALIGAEYRAIKAGLGNVTKQRIALRTLANAHGICPTTLMRYAEGTSQAKPKNTTITQPTE